MIIRAYPGKLMAELHIKYRENPAGCPEAFDRNGNYSKVLRFWSDQLKTGILSLLLFNLRPHLKKCHLRKHRDCISEVPVFSLPFE